MVTLTTDNGTYNVTLTADLTADGNKVAFYAGKHNFLRFAPVTAEPIQRAVTVNGVRYLTAVDGGITVSITDIIQASAPTTSATINIGISDPTDTLTITLIIADGIKVGEWLRLAPRNICNTGITDSDMPMPMLIRSEEWDGDTLCVPIYTTDYPTITAIIDGVEYTYYPYMQQLILHPDTHAVGLWGNLQPSPIVRRKHIQTIRLADTNQPTALVSWSARVGADIINQPTTTRPHKQVLWEVAEVTKNYETTELATFGDISKTDKTESVSIKLRLRDLDAYSVYWYSDILGATDIHVALSATEDIGSEATGAVITDKSITISATKKTDLSITLKLAEYGTV